MASARARLKLDDLKARRAVAPELAREASPSLARKDADEEPRRGQTLRLKAAAWTQLKILAAEQQKTAHDLLIEAVNLMFQHYGKPTIAG
jgi:hypothetical protein